MVSRKATIVIDADSTSFSEAMRHVASESEKTATKVSKDTESAMKPALKGIETLSKKVEEMTGLPVEGFFRRLSDGADKTNSKLDETAGKLDKLRSGLAQGFKVGATAAAGSALAIGGYALDEGLQSQNVEAGFGATLKSTGQGSIASHKASIDALTQSYQALGYTQDDVEQALQAGVVATGSYTKATKDLSLASDLAAAKHMSLSSAMTLVARASEGNTRLLKQNGIDLPIVAGGALKVQQAQQALAKAQDAANTILAQTPDAVNPASKAHAAYAKALQTVTDDHTKLSEVQASGTEVLDALTKRFGGQAAAASETYAGKMRAMHAEVTNLSIKLGEALLPVLSKVLGIVTHSISWLEKHRAVLAVLAGVVGGIVVAAFAAWVSELYATAAAGVAAMVPFLPWIVILGAIAAAAYELYKHWHDVWGWIKDIIHDAVSFVKSHFDDLLLAMGPIGWAILVLKDNWHTVWDAVKDAISDAWAFIKPIFDAIKQAIGDVTGAISKVTGAMSSVAHIGGSIVGGVGSLLGFDAGGLVPGPTGAPLLAKVHGGEYVLPAAVVTAISSGSKITASSVAAGQYAGGLTGGIAGAGGTSSQPVPGQTVNVYAQTNASPHAIAAELGWALRTAPVAR